MSAARVFAADESTRLDALLLFARHLRLHSRLPDPHAITVDHIQQRVRLQLLSEPDHELSDLLRWHESLRTPVAEIWRTPCGTRLVISAQGQTGDGLPVEVFTGLDQVDASALFAIQPNTAQTITREELVGATSAGLPRPTRVGEASRDTDVMTACASCNPEDAWRGAGGVLR